MEYNIYCDESNHLLNDESNVMVLGSVWLEKQKSKEVNERIREIKLKHNLNSLVELKWTKISHIKYDIYEDLVNYFFDDDDLHFRCVLVPNKSIINHENFNQTHDDWYYKMFFNLLKVIFTPYNQFNIYLDYKDTNMTKKSKHLLSVIENAGLKYNYSKSIIKKIQPIRSNEVEIMQIVDILTGAVGYNSRQFNDAHIYNQGKLKIIDLIKTKSKNDLKTNTLYRESKFNMLIWEPNDYV